MPFIRMTRARLYASTSRLSYGGLAMSRQLRICWSSGMPFSCQGLRLLGKATRWVLRWVEMREARPGRTTRAARDPATYAGMYLFQIGGVRHAGCRRPGAAHDFRQPRHTTRDGRLYARQRLSGYGAAHPQQFGPTHHAGGNARGGV